MKKGMDSYAFWNIDGTGTKIALVVLLIVIGMLVRNNMSEKSVSQSELRTEKVKTATVYGAYGMGCDLINRKLKAPSTAKFHIVADECKEVANQEWLVVGTVDAQNEYGAMLRTKWRMQLKTVDGGDNWQLTSGIETE